MRLTIHNRLRIARINTVFCMVAFAAVCVDASAQKLAVVIHVSPSSSSRLLIEASGPASLSWSFPDSYAGVLGLASRVDRFQLFDSQGREIPVRKLAPGQFASDAPAAKFKYEMQVAPS